MWKEFKWKSCFKMIQFNLSGKKNQIWLIKKNLSEKIKSNRSGKIKNFSLKNSTHFKPILKITH